ncbi:zinc transporter 1-like isoform X2 [Branchiostoma floridae]|uniref:Zinc transporter 1-like isoform X2 n=1 Tax=Branchiostoma floridae TaxID=7739 RepID=A0A9J7MM06_BRAFL|nr:zinc transporter 1-like isoform X2 [Branchiostoma floridae]
MGRYNGKTCRLMTLIVLTGLFFVVEITVGYVTNSMALVADSFHCLSDMVSLIVGLSAMRFSKKRVVHLNTFGWVRAEVLGGLVNCIFLLALCFSILVESFKRLIMPELVESPLLMVIIGGVSLAFYLFGMGLLRGLMVGKHGHLHTADSPTGQDTAAQTGKDNVPSRELVSETDSGYDVDQTVDPDNRRDSDAQLARHGSHSSINSDMGNSACRPQDNAIADATQMNLRGVFLHVLGDALSSLIIVVNALIIMYVQGDWTKYCDPVLSILMVVIIIATTVPLLRQSGSILLQSVPPSVRMKKLRTKLQQIVGIVSIHELHVWPLTGEKIVATLHVVFLSPLNYLEICREIKDLFHDEGIHSTTIQPEFSQGVGSSCHCLLDCNRTCSPNQCCTTDTDKQLGAPDKASLRRVLFPCLGHPEDDALIQPGDAGRRPSLNEHISPDQASLPQDSTNPSSDAVSSDQQSRSSNCMDQSSAASISLSGYSDSRFSVVTNNSNNSAVVADSTTEADGVPVVSSLPCLGMQQTNLSPPTSMLEMVQSSPDLHDTISTNSDFGDTKCSNTGGSPSSESLKYKHIVSPKNIRPGQMHGIRHVKSVDHLEESIKEDAMGLRNAKSAHFGVAESTRNRFKGVQHKVQLHGYDNGSKTESSA